MHLNESLGFILTNLDENSLFMKTCRSGAQTSDFYILPERLLVMRARMARNPRARPRFPSARTWRSRACA